MPLSEHEQRLLEQIERALYAEDPKFAHTWRAKADVRSVRRARIVRGVAAVVIGLGLLLGGVVVQGTKKILMTRFRGVPLALVLGVVLGIAGFLAMLGGAWLLLSSRRPAVSVATRAPAPPRIGIKQRLEERWERRQDRD